MLRSTFILLLLLAFWACDDPGGPNFNCTEAGQHILLNDGSLARIAQIQDGRCPCFADCAWAGQINLTILIGTDTILATNEGYGFGAAQSTSDPEAFIYQTRRGDQLQVLDYGPEAQNCPGTVRQEDFCLQIEVLD